MTRNTLPVLFSLGRAWRLMLTLSLAGACAACGASRGGPIPYDVALEAPDAPASSSTYVWALGPLDVVEVKVFQVDDLSGQYQVGANGALVLPLLGSVPVQGQTPAQFGKTLEGLYSQRYLNNPDISVRIVESSQRNVVVEGGVSAPGVYPLQGDTSLLGALALARGIAPETGNAHRVAIFRTTDGQRTAAAFDVVSIRRGEMANPLIYPGDTIVVDSTSSQSTFRDIIQLLPIIALFRTF